MKINDYLHEFAGQVVVLEQDLVLQDSMPSFNFTTDLRVVRRAANVVHAMAIELRSQVVGDAGRSVVAEQSGFVPDRRAVTI